MNNEWIRYIVRGVLCIVYITTAVFLSVYTGDYHWMWLLLLLLTSAGE